MWRSVFRTSTIFLVCCNSAYGDVHLNTEKGNVSSIKSALSLVKVPDNLKIPEQWKAYLNPTTDVFWSEGNHTPDAGFLIFAKDPTVENAKLWLLRMETKARYLETMMRNIGIAQKDLIENGFIKDRYGEVKRAKALPNFVKADLKEIQYYFLFHPSCQICRELAQTLTSFPNVIPLQITKDALHDWPGLVKSRAADEETIKTYVHGKVPVLVISDPKLGNVTVLEGGRSYQDILLAASTLLGKRTGGTK